VRRVLAEWPRVNIDWRFLANGGMDGNSSLRRHGWTGNFCP
jgi:hypothetical protein